MTPPVSVSLNSPQFNTPVQSSSQPVGAFGIGRETQNNAPAAGHFVVNPPVIRPYSFYDTVKLDDSFYKQLLGIKDKSNPRKYTEAPNIAPNPYNKPPKKNSFKKVFWSLALIGAGVLCFVKRKPIKEFIVKYYNNAKDYIKNPKK